MTLENGVTLAASINGMPHGGGSIADNNFEGHICIHFLNSRTHGTDNVDPDHQNAVGEAAGKYDLHPLAAAQCNTTCLTIGQSQAGLRLYVLI